MSDNRSVIRNCRLFTGLDDAQCDRLAAMSLRQTFKRGEAIFAQDDPCPGIYIVETGLVRLFKLNAAGKEHVLHLVSDNATFAEVAAIGGFACPANAQALEDTSCVLIPAAPFMKAMRSDHDLCLQMMVGMAVWVRQLIGLIEDIVLRDAIGRLARYLLDVAVPGNDRVELPALKRHLASHLNLTSETLSRTLGRLIEAKLVEEIDNRTLRLVDREALADVAEGLGL